MRNGFSRLFAVLLAASLITSCSGATPPAQTPSLASPGGSSTALPGNPSNQSTSQPDSSSGAAGQPPSVPLVLNEVLFQPAAGSAQFVEIKNSSSGNVQAAGLELTNSAGQTTQLPPSLAPLAAGQFLLVLFDGQNKVEDSTVHSALTQFLQVDSEQLQLVQNGSDVLDQVEWGANRNFPVWLSKGGVTKPMATGSSIGRFPSSSGPLASQDWSLFAPQEASPGKANPQPGVEGLLPWFGAVFETSKVSLSWYPSSGAAQYKVQISADPGFGTLALEQTVDAVGFSTDALKPGLYYWRVQALAQDKSAAAFSPPAWFTLAGAALKPSVSSGGVALASNRTQAGNSNPLKVPYLTQHKDTRMLELEEVNETGQHAWDVNHQTLDTSDKADNTNCSLASIAMVAAFYGGNLSQDRLGYEVFKDALPGPEHDLNYGPGLNDKQINQALIFALNAAPTYHARPATAADLWNAVVKEIDAGRPLVVTNPNHVVVVTGYLQQNGIQYLKLNDPWAGQYYIDVSAPVSNLNFGKIWDTYWTMPQVVKAGSDEPTINQDTDGDGIVDFDEINRFHTNPNDQDTDQDKVPDKADVRASVFDTQHGYAFGHKEGRDFDKDGKPMELDEDSDNGGCFDGMEDTNFNGKYQVNLKETNNFDPTDDACISGTYVHYRDSSITLPGNNPTTTHTTYKITSRFSVKPTSGNKLEGWVQSTQDPFTVEIISTDPGSVCPDIVLSGETVVWGASLAGELVTQAGGILHVAFRATPSNGPGFTVDMTGCPAGQPSHEDGPSWSGMSGDLVNGKYSLHQDLTLPAGETGTFYLEVNMEQKKGK